MKRWITGAFLLILMLLGGFSWWGMKQWTGSGPMPEGSAEYVLVEIPPGMTLKAAADTLVSHGLLRDRRVLLLGARAVGLDRGLRAGLYRLVPGTSPRELLNNLTSGSSVQIRVTVAEGLDAEETARIMASALEFCSETFLTVADSLVRLEAEAGKLLMETNSPARLDSILVEASAPGTRRFHWCEGYLAPDTYLFSVGTSAEAAATHLFHTQLARLDSAFSLASTKPSVFGSPHQLLTLASIVEAEARHDDERPLIAAVYSNRLQRNWRLEADPTVAYVLRKRGKRMFFKDLEVDSPYNAYRNKGLPPGCIGNPGFASILAAAQPDSACAAMFFVSDGKGGHIFSRTAREHEEAVARFRKAKAAERRRQR
jgi:UPF0755 protein